MNFVHIGWCREDSRDKVWGIIQLLPPSEDYDHRRYSKFVTFWGRRGKKLQTKIWDGSDWDAKEMFLKKQNKGYQSIEVEELDRVYPEFREDLGKITMIAILKA